MIGRKLAAAIRTAKGKISVPVLVHNDIAYIYAEKADLIKWANEMGSHETGMKLEPEECGQGTYLAKEEV